MDRLRNKYGLTGVQDQIDSGNIRHFTPYNTPYWVFIGLFFLCYGLTYFWGTDTIVPDPDTGLVNSTFLQTEQQPRMDVIYQGLCRKIDDVSEFGQFGQLMGFLAMRPSILDSIPSSVPLFRESFVFTSPYGNRTHPIHKTPKGHLGIDLAAERGTPLYCTAAGTVAHIGDDPKGHGLHIIVSHAHGFSTLYGHLETVAVSLGEQLPPHEFIGTVGSSGLSTGPHLHYETIKNGKRIDPLPSLNIKYRVYARLTQNN
ncbi:MAG: M23 family metallopeptidase [Bacteroidota bacterium]